MPAFSILGAYRLRVFCEELSVGLVDLGVVIHARQKDSYLDGICQACARSLQNGVEVTQGLSLQ